MYIATRRARLEAREAGFLVCEIWNPLNIGTDAPKIQVKKYTYAF